ncbi:hypothetical protein PAI11_37470 [Patulibacter medicamentivorans]|uniref:Uncharacterized protein n=1 Tax=Patulibacter medicamentivorans TaxID=1097667 RepID=H0EA73_9ACTN|nr:hypothetical protein [Patulibacter medicamentivorans]EHN09413.1 hypothetical protein PAI11_37470 [Patulibacter medicamentivorans]
MADRPTTTDPDAAARKWASVEGLRLGHDSEHRPRPLSADEQQLADATRRRLRQRADRNAA